jgi:glycosyltransferase involved in cell wall biosynthesis
MKPDFSILIPAYNEEENVEDLFQAMDAFLAGCAFTAEVVFIDDGSADRTVELLKAHTFHHAQKKIVKLSRNFGAFSALRAGILHAASDNCMFYSMDMPEPVEVIGTFYEKLMEGNDIVVSTRRGYKMSLGSKIFTKLQKKFVCDDFPENGIASAAINGKVKRELNSNIEGDTPLLFQIYNMGFRKCYIESHIQERQHGASKWTLSKKIRLFIDTFVSFSNLPIRFISSMGILFALVGILYALVIIVIKVFDLMELALGWPALISIILIGFGVTNLSIGVLSEYLVRTLDAARNRPAFIVDEIYGPDGERIN